MHQVLAGYQAGQAIDLYRLLPYWFTIISKIFHRYPHFNKRQDIYRIYRGYIRDIFGISLFLLWNKLGITYNLGNTNKGWYVDGRAFSRMVFRKFSHAESRAGNKIFLGCFLSGIGCIYLLLIINTLYGLNEPFSKVSGRHHELIFPFFHIS